MSRDFPSHETLMRLAQQNPEELERLRKYHVDAIIEAAPVHMRRRLQGLQFQIDCTRRLHPSPLGSCLSISKLMMKSLHSLNMVLRDGPTTPSADEPRPKNSPRSPARVIPFHRSAN